MENGQVRAQSFDRIGSLDGMRGIAILSVILLHWVIRPTEEAIQAVSPQIYQLLNQAAHGVDIFFVISGFLIGRILLTRAGEPAFLKVFYIRRFLRIIPLYYAVLCLIVLGRFTFGGFPEGHVPVSAYFLFINNFFDAYGWRSLPGFGLFWSLAIEEQFYLTSALVVATLGRRGVIFLAISFVLGSMIFRILSFTSFIHVTWWPLTLAHTDPIGIGLLVAAILTNNRASQFLTEHAAPIKVAGVASLIAFATASQFHAARFLGLDVLSISISIACWILLKFLFQPKSLLSSTALRRVGEMSFALYIIHQSWILYSGWLFGGAEGFGVVGIAINFVLLLGVCRLLWVYVESPLIGLGHTWRYSAERLKT